MKHWKWDFKKIRVLRISNNFFEPVLKCKIELNFELNLYYPLWKPLGLITDMRWFLMLEKFGLQVRVMGIKHLENLVLKFEFLKTFWCLIPRFILFKYYCKWIGWMNISVEYRNSEGQNHSESIFQFFTFWINFSSYYFQVILSLEDWSMLEY